MSQAAASQIVHESEAQRQHVRLPLPARAIIKGQEYDVRDLSPAGMGIRGITGAYERGTILAVTLRLPFGTFTLDLSLQGEVQHYNEAEKLLGCHFTNLTTDQLALINHVLKAFLAGDVVASGDLLNVASRDSFVKTRRQNGPAVAGAAPGFDIRRQIPGLAIMGVLGLIAAYVIGGNLYESAFVLKSTDAYVSTRLVTVDAPAEGTFKLALPVDTALVEAGQVIGTVTARDETLPPAQIVSPCHCQISRIQANDGEYVAAGAPVVSLASADLKPVITATIEPVSASRIKSDSKAIITIAGTQRKFSGRVTGMTSGLASQTPNASLGFVPAPVFVTITTDQPLPADLANIPAQVVFTAR